MNLDDSSLLDESAGGTPLPAIPAKRYFTIGEVSELCLVKAHVLRYWEQEFTQLKPVKRSGNRRYYQHHEVLLIRRIRELLYEQGFTIQGARARLENLGTARRRKAAGKTPEATVAALDGGAPLAEVGQAPEGGAPAASAAQLDQLCSELLALRAWLTAVGNASPVASDPATGPACGVGGLDVAAPR
jgi:DNA-binding transcriptional MerR regulator